jgi:glycosyltransferase involved in cell wall biosynthesis
MNILILNVQVPFTRGGAEGLVDSLKAQLVAAGHSVDIVSLPFSAEPKTKLVESMILWRALDLTEFAGKKVDLVIGTKFPSYLVKHPNKIVWLVHQHRQLYDLYGTRFGDFSDSVEDESIRQLVYQADEQALNECKSIFTISKNVTSRLVKYFNLDSTVLTPPLPLSGRYRNGRIGNYILYVGRICSIKRVDLIIRAFSQVNESLSLKIVGLPDEPAIEEFLKSEISKHNLSQRVEFLGRVDDETLLDLYADSFAVYYAPFDEDYGFVTLEALASGKPVITANDSGGVLQFIENEKNGVVVNPNEEAVAAAINRLFVDKELYQRLSLNSQQTKCLVWPDVIQTLTSKSLNQEKVSPSQAANG